MSKPSSISISTPLYASGLDRKIPIHDSAREKGVLKEEAELRRIRVIEHGKPVWVRIFCSSNFSLDGLTEITVSFGGKSVKLPLAVSETTPAEAPPKPAVVTGLQFKGVAVSPGHAHGPVSVWQPWESETPIKRTIADDKIEAEVEKFHKAIDATKADYQKYIDGAGESESTRRIFEAHKLAIDDLAGQVTKKIREEKCNAEFALHERINWYIDFFQQIQDNADFAGKADDLQSIWIEISQHLS
ncbi:MAG TPA: phosphoenolpyruvate-utilizing N-terminal domain-containing protein, partial [Candidatus Sulfotelmatobacter sp.]|nr:phosphoenolpyruvate-utilizing N-terminal domain-containing protein [Candidatus Sulfotelmatobacter sp.]